MNILRQKKLRMSRPRLLIYHELAEAKEALSPKELHKRLISKKRKIGLSSVYRSLELFESKEIVFKLTDRTGVVYGLCRLENHHHHLVCKGCGAVVEIDFCDFPEWSQKVMKSTGYLVTHHQLNLYGLCKECQA